MKNTRVDAPTTEWVPVAQLSFDPTVNTRPTKSAKVHKIAKNFDPSALRFIEVSLRDDGTYVVLDGMHRVSALREMGWTNGQKVECKVHRGLTHERECELFDLLNDQLLMQAMPRMLARVGAQLEPDYSIARVVASVGLGIGNQKHDGMVCSAKALYKIYGGGRWQRGVQAEAHPDLLRATLRLAMSAWGKDKDALRGDVLMGIGIFLARYGDAIDSGALVTKLAQLKGGPLALLADGRTLSALHNSQLDSGIAGKLVFLYNEKRRSRKLPDWWSA